MKTEKEKIKELRDFINDDICNSCKELDECEIECEECIVSIMLDSINGD